MKKFTCYVVVTGMAVSLCACQKVPRTAEEETTTELFVTEVQTETQAQSEQETMQYIRSTVQPNERTTHHETDVEKDRLLAFLNNELSLLDYPCAKPGEPLYYGDIAKEAAEEKTEEPRYLISDVTGNEKNEYVFYLEDRAVCMVYDESNEQFSCLWSSDTQDTFFLGNGQILTYAAGETNIYTYFVLDETGKITNCREFTITLDDKPLIMIDGEEVTEDTWKEEFDWIMDLYHTREKLMTLEDLSK